MPAVDRNLLRMAVGEMLAFKGTPFPIVINEALEIATTLLGAGVDQLSQRDSRRHRAEPAAQMSCARRLSNCRHDSQYVSVDFTTDSATTASNAKRTEEMAFFGDRSFFFSTRCALQNVRTVAFAA